MQNIKSSGSIYYTGTVTIKLKNLKTNKILDTRVIKNAGTSNLFQYLCSCLIGQFEANNRPRYLDASSLLYSTTSGYNFNSNLAYRSIISNSNLASNSEEITTSSGGTYNEIVWHAKYSATILRNQLDTAAQTEGIKSLALFNSPVIDADNSGSLLAWIDILEDPIIIGDKQAILIEWDMSFSNYIKNALENI